MLNYLNYLFTDSRYARPIWQAIILIGVVVGITLTLQRTRKHPLRLRTKMLIALPVLLFATFVLTYVYTDGQTDAWQLYLVFGGPWLVAYGMYPRLRKTHAALLSLASGLMLGVAVGFVLLVAFPYLYCLGNRSACAGNTELAFTPIVFTITYLLPLLGISLLLAMVHAITASISRRRQGSTPNQPENTKPG